MAQKIGINNFVKRQTADSRFSHFDGDFEAVAKLAETHFAHGKQGYKDGVLLIDVPPDGFFSGVVEVNEQTELKAVFEARRQGEDPYIQIIALNADKLPAKKVELVLYQHEVLGNDANTECDWELISINARPTVEDEPQTPMAMARNFLELPGGTKANYTAKQFADAILYWSKRALASDKK